MNNIENVFVNGKLETLYSEAGNDEKGTIICINGLEAGAFVWNKFVDEASQNGYKVVTYEFYKKHKGITFNCMTYVHQLRQLIEELKMEDKQLILVGFSFGAVIASAYMEKYSGNVKKNVLISPLQQVNPKSMMIRVTSTLCRIKKFEEKMDEKFLWHTERNFYDESLKENYNNDLADFMAFGGYTRGYTKTLLEFEFLNINEMYKNLKIMNNQCIIVWGEEDEVLPVDYLEVTKKVSGIDNDLVVPKAGHMIMMEKPNSILDILENE